MQIGPTNNEVGQAWTAYMLGELYISWPRRLDLNWMDIGRAVGLEPRTEAEELFDDLLRWLKDNGYVAFEQSVDGNAFDVALTDKGYAVLGKAPIHSERPLDVQMKAAAISAGKDAGRAIIASLIGALVSAALKS